MNIKYFIQAILQIKKNLEIISLRVLCLKLCQQANLTDDEANTIMAVISAESGWNPKAINKNSDGSIDYGLCQYNSYWYISKMKLITQWEALNDYEKCIKLMIQRYKEGFLKDWASYKFGTYKKFLA